MTYQTLKAARASQASLVARYRDQLQYVRLLSGRWCVVLGAPDAATTRHVRGDVWHQCPRLRLDQLH